MTTTKQNICECCEQEIEEIFFSPYAKETWDFNKLCVSCYVDLEEK